MSADDSQKGEFERLLKAFHSAQERGDFEEAESIGVQCLAFASAEAERNPSESVRVVQEAHEHENAARWEQAEAAHRRALALARAEGNAAMIFKAHDDLRTLYVMCGKADKALQEAQVALQGARKTDISPLLLIALGGLFQCHLMKGDMTSATAIADEAVQVVPAEKMYDGQRARALLMRARSRVEQGQVSQAEQDLEVAWRILAPQAKAAMFAGVQSSLAVWWEITARIRTRAEDFVAAAQAMGKAVEFRRTVSQLPQLEGPHKHHALAKALREYSVVLLSAGEVEAAIGAFDKAARFNKRSEMRYPRPARYKIGGDEPPPRFSAQCRAAIREPHVRATVPVGGGRSPWVVGRFLAPRINGQFTFSLQIPDNLPSERLTLDAMKLLRHSMAIVCLGATFIANAGERLTTKAKCVVNQPTNAELQLLQGTWEGAVVGDKSHEKITITITANSFHFHRDTNFWFETTITLSAGTDPKQLYATIKGCPPSQADSIGKVVGAIFKVEDGTLTLATGGDSGPEGTPKSFEATEDKGLTRYELRKVQLQKENTQPFKIK